MGASPQTLDALRWVRDDFCAIASSAGGAELDAPSRGTRWTNRQLLFHMWFGQRIARAFIPVFGILGRLPRPVAVGYARLLSALTGPYNWINYIAPVGGAELVGAERVMRWMRADTERLVRWATSATNQQLRLTAPVPADWDPNFQPEMTRLDILDWAPKHYRHHRTQLSLTALPEPPH